MAQTIYSRELLRWASCLYRWPLDCDAPLQHSVTAQPCGSRLTLSLSLDNQGLISALGMDCQSCAFGQASAAIMAHHLVGKQFADAAHMASILSQLLKGDEIVSDMASEYPEFALLAAAAAHRARHPAIMLPYQALQVILRPKTGLI